MGQHLLWLAGWTMWLLAAAVYAGEGPERQTVKVELQAEPQTILAGKGQSERANIDIVVSEMPPAISAAVKEWTGIADQGQKIGVKFIHSPRDARFDAMSFAEGTGGYKGFLKSGEKVLQNEETHVRYKASLEASDEKTFFVVGLLEFENSVTKRQCFVLCQFEGHKPPASAEDPIIHPTGTATWTGPILTAKRPPPPANPQARK
jgi:hypothetical protein